MADENLGIKIIKDLRINHVIFYRYVQLAGRDGVVRMEQLIRAGMHS